MKRNRGIKEKAKLPSYCQNISRKKGKRRNVSGNTMTPSRAINNEKVGIFNWKLKQYE